MTSVRKSGFIRPRSVLPRRLSLTECRCSSDTENRRSQLKLFPKVRSRVRLSSSRKFTSTAGPQLKPGTPSYAGTRCQLPVCSFSLSVTPFCRRPGDTRPAWQAAAQYVRARELRVTEPEIAWRLAVLRDRLGDSVQATKEYDLACKHLPQNADLWNDRGCSDLHQQNYPAAEKSFRQALTLQPQHDRATMNLGLVLAAQERYEEAADCFAAVVGPAAAQSNLGMILARQGRRESAESAFERSLAEDSSLRQPQAALAVLRNRDTVSPASFE